MPKFARLKRLLFGPALAAGLTLLLAPAAPARAQLFYDQPRFFTDQPRFFNDEDAAPSRAARAHRNKPPRETHRFKPEREAKRDDSEPKRETKRHDRETKHEQPAAQGPFQVVVAIARQQVTLYGQNGAIAQGPVSTGMPDHPTPLGVFSVLSKDKWHQSNIYSGAPMPYMQRITWSGIAMHAGALPGYPASHGCIRLLESLAIKLWGITKVGARVIVTREPVAPVEIVHRNLFVPKKPEEKPASVAPAATPVMTAAVGTTEMAAASHIEDGKHAGKTADIIGTIVEPAAPADIIRLPGVPKPKAELPKRTEPVQVFVSRKEAKFYVRQGFTQLFDAPLTIAELGKPWGTHVFTVMAIKDDTARWTSLSIPSGYARKTDTNRSGRKRSAREIEQEKRAADLAHAPTAAEALERFELPKDAVDRISELLAPGSALIVSDNALSDETDSDTSFIVHTH